MIDFSHSIINRGPKLKETKVCTNTAEKKLLSVLLYPSELFLIFRQFVEKVLPSH